jgi:hypothetical protein
MPGTLYDTGAVAVCPHGGTVTVVTTDVRVLAGDLPVALAGDQYLVAGCPLAGTGTPPCVKVQWLVPALRTFVDGQPAVLNTSTGLCLSAAGAPTGPPLVLTTQIRVVAT